MKLHPLFPNHPDAHVARITLERLTRSSASPRAVWFDRAPGLYPAETLLNLDQLAARWGGGTYRLYGLDAAGAVVARTDAWIPGEPASLDLDPELPRQPDSRRQCA